MAATPPQGASCASPHLSPSPSGLAFNLASLCPGAFPVIAGANYAEAVKARWLGNEPWFAARLKLHDSGANGCEAADGGPSVRNI